VFVGHGLLKDFETANIFVPPQQIRDTVELWRLPNQRKISLRFLAFYILNEHIQDEIHDSCEDSRVALDLYRKYEETIAQGWDHLQSILYELYQFGNKTNWTIGLELSSPMQHLPTKVSSSLKTIATTNTSTSSSISTTTTTTTTTAITKS
jgi:hypothetical protein